MQEKIKLKNFDESKELNEKVPFNSFDYIYNNFVLKDVNDDIYFTMLELYWPSFLKFKNYIFLKEEFLEIRVNELEKQNENVEFWMNLLTLNCFFKNDDESQNGIIFTRKLVEIWNIKLKLDFPDLEFIVAFLEDEEYGNYGVTFYQKKFDKNKYYNPSENQDFPKPNILENFINFIPEKKSLPGRTKIRPSRQDEIPEVQLALENPQGFEKDGPHNPNQHKDPRALRPHEHVSEITNPDGTPWLPINF